MEIIEIKMARRAKGLSPLSPNTLLMAPNRQLPIARERKTVNMAVVRPQGIIRDTFAKRSGLRVL